MGAEVERLRSALDELPDEVKARAVPAPPPAAAGGYGAASGERETNEAEAGSGEPDGAASGAEPAGEPGTTYDEESL